MKQKYGSLALLIVSFIILLAIARPALAQVTSGRTTPSENEIYGSYSYSFRDYANTQDGPTSGGMSGWQASYKAPLRHWIGLKVDGTGYYKSEGSSGLNPHVYFIAAGPQFSRHYGAYTAFAHALFGTAHLSGVFPLTSSFSISAVAGGGIDRTISRRLAWRVSADYLYTHYTAGGQETNQLHNLVASNGRVSTGPVFRF